MEGGGVDMGGGGGCWERNDLHLSIFNSSRQSGTGCGCCQFHLPVLGGTTGTLDAVRCHGTSIAQKGLPPAALQQHAMAEHRVALMCPCAGRSCN